MWKPIALVSIAALLQTSCSRGKSESASLTFSLPPKAAKVATANAKLVPLENLSGMTQTPGPVANPVISGDDSVLSHVIINITGSGISAPILFTWDRHDNPNIPAAFTIDNVPRGDGRLIQVLAVYQAPISQTMTIFYGDANKSLSAAEESVEVSVTSISGSTTSVDGSVSGRYLTGPNSGPTADVAIKFQPPGKPAMIVERRAMYNGWFSVFALSNVNFIYELQPGPMQQNPEILFGGPVNIHSPIFDPNENAGAEWYRRSAAYIPFHLRGEYGNGGTLTWKADTAQIYVWGFWGNAAARADASWSARAVCRDNLSGSFTRLKQYTGVVANQPAQPALTVTNLINIGLIPPTDAALLDQVASLGAVTFLGGETSCTSKPQAGEYQDWFRVTKAMVDGDGGDSAAGFRGPFRVDLDLNPFSIGYSDPRVIKADVLPGVTAAVDEIRFYKKSPVTSDFRLESPDCNALQNSFTIAGSAGVDAAGHVVINTNISSTEAAGGVAGVMCAFKNGRPYTAGIFVEAWRFQSAGGGGGPVATKLNARLVNTDASNQVYNYTCVPVLIQGQDANNNPAPIPLGASIGATASAADKFFSNPDCSTPLPAGNWNGQWVGNGMMVYYSSERTGGNPGVSVTLTASGLAPSTLTMNTSDNGTPATYLNMGGNPTNIQAFGCHPLNMFTTTGAGSTIPANMTPPSQDYLSLTVDSPYVSFYMDPMCSTPLSTLNFGGPAGAAVTSRTVFFSYASLTAVSFNINVSGLGQLTSAKTISYTAAQVGIPGAGARLNLMMPYQMMAGSCYDVTVQLVDSMGQPTPLLPSFGGDGSVALNAGALGQFYYDKYCTSPVTSVTIASDGLHTSAVAGFKPLATGTGQATATMTGTSATYTGSAPFNVSTETATQVVFVFPGQTWTPGNTYVSGPAQPVFAGVPVTVDVYAVKASDKSIDPTYVSGLGLGLSGTAPFTVANAGGFTAGDAGHKQIQITFNTPPMSDFANPSNFTNMFGLQIPPGFSSSYYMSVQSNVPQQVTVYGGAGSGQYHLDPNTCQPVVLQRAVPFSYNSHTYAPALPGGNAFIAGTASGSTQFYSEQTCTNVLADNQTIIPAGTGQVIAWVKWSNPSYNSAGYNSGGVPFPGFSWDGYGDGAPAVSVARYNILGPTGIVTGVCQPFAVTATDGNYNSASVSDSVTFSMPFGGAQGQFYSDANCTTSISGLTFANERIKTFYFKTALPMSGYDYVQINVSGAYGGSTVVDVLHYQ